MTYQYPPSPTVKDYSFLNPSPGFKKQVYSMITGISMFIGLYLLLISGSILLMVACFYLGVGVIMLRPSFLTLAAGLGIMALGVMFFLFLIKFIFSKTVEGDSQQIEITEEDHPELFVFIKKVTEEVKTDFPKHIYLIPGVNAYVSHSSSFWSMFLPVRKNLTIGLGLVNSLNLSEFKATLAHEFGHFSQRSMTLGSYVYTVNKVIFNLVNQRDGWDNTLERWANAGGVFGFFAGVTFWLVNQVRSALLGSYKKLNVRYMALSREMEYHADLVACSAAGNAPMIQTLRKLEFTEVAYQYMIGRLNQLYEQNKKSINIYDFHEAVMHSMVRQNKINLVNNLPVITNEDLEKNKVKSRVNAKDQWASHPSREEREASINSVQLLAETVPTSAWVLFKDVENCKNQMTLQLYNIGLPKQQELQVTTQEDFMELLKADEKKNHLPEIYKGFYDDRLLKEFDVAAAAQEQNNKSFDELFTKNTKEFFDRHNMNQTDRDQLKVMDIHMYEDDVFEFDYQKRKGVDIAGIVKELDKEIETNNQQILNLDRQAFQYFYNLAKPGGVAQPLQEVYQKLFDKQKPIRELGKIVERTQNLIRHINSKAEWTNREINEINSTGYQVEGDFKDFLKQLPYTVLLETISNKEEFIRYGEGKISRYLLTFNMETLGELTGRIFEVFGILHAERFDLLKEMTELQLPLIREMESI